MRLLPAVIGATSTGPTPAARYAAACSGWARAASGKNSASCEAKTRQARKPLSPATTFGNAPSELSKDRAPLCGWYMPIADRAPRDEPTPRSSSRRIASVVGNRGNVAARSRNARSSGSCQ